MKNDGYRTRACFTRNFRALSLVISDKISWGLFFLLVAEATSILHVIELLLNSLKKCSRVLCKEQLFWDKLLCWVVSEEMLFIVSYERITTPHLESVSKIKCSLIYCLWRLLTFIAVFFLWFLRNIDIYKMSTFIKYTFDINYFDNFIFNDTKHNVNRTKHTEYALSGVFLWICVDIL